MNKATAATQTGKSRGKFMILWAGQLVSNIGSGMSAFALGVHVFRQTGSAANFSFVVLCLFLPAILFRPVGGVLADRLDRRWLIVAGDAGSALSVLFILASLLSGSLPLWKIYLGVSLNSLSTSLQSPAYKASVTDLLPEEEYAKAAGLVQLASSAQHLLAPVCAGFLLAIGSLETILLIDVSTFVLAVAAAMSMPKNSRSAAQGGSGHLLTDLREGWRAVTSDLQVRRTVLLISLVTFFVGLLQTLFAPMMLGLTDAKTLGISQSSGAAGMLISALLLGSLGLKRRPETALMSGLSVAGLAMAGMGLSEHILFISAAFFVFFCTLPFINTGAEVIIRGRIPNEKQGRAWGIVGVLSQLGYIIAYLCSGMLAERLFEPLLAAHGALAATAGRVIGTGPGRGIALMLILSGISVFIISLHYASAPDRSETANRAEAGRYIN